MELSKNLMCIQIRSGVEIWLEDDRADKLRQSLMTLTSHKFIGLDNKVLNTADIVGIFEATDMQDLTRRKNNQWKCEHGEWHEKGGVCQCLSKKELKLNKLKEKSVQECGKCVGGYVLTDNRATKCECIKSLQY